MRLAPLRICSGPICLFLIVVLLAQMTPARAWADDSGPHDLTTDSQPIDANLVRDLASQTKLGDGPTEEGARGGHDEQGRVRNLVDDRGQKQAGPLQYTRGSNGEASSGPAAPPGPQGGGAPAKRAPAGPQLSLPQGAAKLRGLGESFSAELSTGIARYQVPFDLPAARGGVQPSLGLAYSSAGGHGIAGVGWSTGAPTISRQIDRGVSKYKDPDPGVPWDPNQDRFVVGAEELVPICVVAGTTCAVGPDGLNPAPGEVMPAWASGWRYFRTRVEGAFLRYFWSSNHRTWRVQGKNGVSMELGVPLHRPNGEDPNDESALEVDPSDASKVFAWHVVRSYDTMGDANPAGTAPPKPVNIVYYKYETSDGATYLTDIFDTPPVADAANASLADYAHHTHLRYEPRPDVATSYRRGWAVRATRRLRGVDVTSYDFARTGTRQLLRRYHLAYEPSSHVSLLQSVQMEGRCASPVGESGGLLPSTSCDKLPAMRFEYQHVTPFRIDGSQTSPDLPGYEGFDERLRTLATSPPHSIHETLTDFADVNSDGLPDILVTDPARYGHGHGVFFNKGTSFAPAKTMCIEGVSGVDANILKFSNPNVSSHDVDGDGTVNFLHMPRTKVYSIFTPKKVEDEWCWHGRPVTTASEQDPKIDFARRNADTRLMDVNADGLVDVVYTSATEVQTFLSLGRYPGGDGQYGQASWTGVAQADIKNEPLSSCIPWSAAPIRFSDPDVHVADMNGDGLPDIVRARHGDVRYWPGRGNGFWGTGDAAQCQGGGFGQDQHVAMSDSPRVGMFGEQPLLFDDINGDGLADLVRVRFDAIDIYLNVDGEGWTDRHVIDNVPANSSVTNRVRLVDVNGSGTPDILWGDGLAYKYVDLAGGARPWLLKKVDNGLGATTELEYSTSVQQMLAAEAVEPWTSKSPMVAHVLVQATRRDNLDRIPGRLGGAYTTKYTYRNAVFEGRQREFRGFRNVQSETMGDANSPTSIAKAEFLLGECVNASGATNCDPSERWRDNPREALKGLPVVAEQLDANGTYLTTAHTKYRLRRLFTGLDGRGVWHAFPVTTDSYRYDTAPFVATTSTVSVSDVETEPTTGSVTQDPSRPVTLRSTAGRAKLQTSVVVDRFGNQTLSRDHGCTAGCGAADEIIDKQASFSRPDGDASGWLWRIDDSFVQGHDSPSIQRNRVRHRYDSRGLATEERVVLSGTLSLDRFHEDPAKDVAPAPAKAISDGEHIVATYEHDAYGSRTVTRTPLGQCRTVVMDPAFGQLVVEAGTSAGYPDSTSGLAACGPYTLTSKAEYDRGLGVITRSEGYGFRVSTATYDGFGRIVAIKEPHPDTLGAPSPVASALYEYDLPTDGIRPYSKIRTRIQDGASVAAESYRDTWSYVDGLGRTLVTLSEADTTAGDAAPWIASGITDYDLKGAASRSYSSSFYGDDPSAYPLETPPTTRFTSARYDAFGRVVESYDLSLAPDYAARPITLRNIYHAMSTEASDADDLEPNGEHENTPVIARVDGHGRRVSEIKRVRVGGQPQNYETNVSYLPTGEPEVIRRTGGPEVVRWMQYDSLGRMVRNVEPNTTKNFAGPSAAPPSTMKAWRYAYDLLGTLVGTSDPNGCGVNYHYLADGRLLGEDYSPCKHHHADYSTPNLTPDGAGAVNGDGLEVYFRYDASDPDASEVSGFEGTPIAAGSPLDVNAGQVSSISDRGSKTMFRRDGRGRTTGIARKMAKPGPPTSALADRYTSHWFVRTVEYDAADRATEESTGADVSALFGADGTSAVTTTYSKRGTVTSVGGSYGALVQSATRDAQGLPEQIVYGDAATTSTTFGYDARDRLSSVRTDRGPPAIWSSPPSSYTPAPDPTGPASVFQPVLENYAYVYDPVGNPITIQDLRDPGYWPAGAKPVTRHFHYDDLYRVASSEQVTPDSWVSPYAEENGDTSGTRTTPMPHVSFTGRMAAQSFQYDAVGNTTSTDDDEHGFYDRSLGTITNGTPSAGPYQLKQAAQASGTRSGALTAAYDDAGQLVGMALRRDGPCLPTGAACSQRFAYEWDEVGNLARARRWDLASPGIASDPLPAGLPAAELRHVYSGAERVLKTAVDTANNELHTVYVFESLELRRAQFVAGEYERTADTEAAYLFAHGVRLARLYYAEEDLPTLSSGHLHVLLELPDHLGSASFVIDKDTGELVEATRYQAYGSVESDYRPARWNAYRSDYRFTGKEEDIEVGLVYFGARYFAPQLNRWISPDPLALHHPGEADLNLYAYVHGRALVAVDPLGLDFDWGALGKAIMGGLELGAGVSAMSTCVTGVGCVVAAAMIYHGADTMVSGIGQLVTGQPVPMTTELAFEGVASVFTDDKATQKKAGVYGNIAFGLALSAMSIATSGAPRVSGGDAMKRAPATDAGRVASSADDAAAAAAAGTGKASGSFPSASQILAEREALDAAKAPTTWGAPGPAAADAAATGGAKAVAGETYEIVDGVRRAKAASELGHTTISAEIQVAEKTIETTQIPISALRSPTKSIIELNSPSRMQRWLDILDGTRKGDALPPIQVTPGSNGTSVPLIKFKF